MAEVKICGVCGQKNGPDRFDCSACGANISYIQTVSDDDVAAPGASSVVPPAEPQAKPTDVRERTCPACGLANAEEAKECLRCGARLGTSAEERRPQYQIEFPWGLLNVDGLVGIGRDPQFSPIHSRLDNYQNVSCRHAEFKLESGKLLLRDIGSDGRGSTNGTFVNDRRIEPLVWHVLRDGDTVRFAARLTTVVRIPIDHVR